MFLTLGNTPPPTIFSGTLRPLEGLDRDIVPNGRDGDSNLLNALNAVTFEDSVNPRKQNEFWRL